MMDDIDTFLEEAAKFEHENRTIKDLAYQVFCLKKRRWEDFSSLSVKVNQLTKRIEELEKIKK